MQITGNCDVCILRKNSDIVYGEWLQPSLLFFFFFFFYIYFIHSYSVFVGFISTDDSLKALSSLGKKRKASQGTEDMTEDYAGIFTTNNEYLCG